VEWLCGNVIKAVPHLHLVMSIPKILRRYFLFDRKLLSELRRCGWESLKDYFSFASQDSKAVPGAAIAIQTFLLQLMSDFSRFLPLTVCSPCGL